MNLMDSEFAGQPPKLPASTYYSESGDGLHRSSTTHSTLPYSELSSSLGASSLSSSRLHCKIESVASSGSSYSYSGSGSRRNSYSYDSIENDNIVMSKDISPIRRRFSNDSLDQNVPKSSQGDIISPNQRSSMSHTYYSVPSNASSESLGDSIRNSLPLSSSTWQVVRKPSRESNVTKYIFVKCKKRHPSENSDSDCSHNHSQSKRNSFVLEENISDRSTPVVDNSSLRDISSSELLRMLDSAYEYVLS